MIEQVIKIARDAAQFMRTRSFSIENKGMVGNDVTTADKNVQEYIRKHLAELDGTVGFIGEESGEQDYANMRAWVVDPIDGTANFIRGLNASVISIGLVECGDAVLGVVYNPYQDEMFYAERGKGAYLNGKPISVLDRDFCHGVYCTAFCLYRKEYAKICQQIMADVYEKCEDFRRIGTAALELTALAAGRVDLYFEMRLYPWDYAASVIIIKEAGGIIGTIERSETAQSLSQEFKLQNRHLIYNRPIPIIAANNQKNYDELEKIIKRYISVVPYED